MVEKQGLVETKSNSDRRSEEKENGVGMAALKIIQLGVTGLLGLLVISMYPSLRRFMCFGLLAILFLVILGLKEC